MNKLYIYYILGLFCICLITSMWIFVVRAGDKGNFTSKSLVFYYNNDQTHVDEMIASMKKGQVIVVDTRVLSKTQLAQLVVKANQKQAKILAYISIGEIGPAHYKKDINAFLAQHKLSWEDTEGNTKSVVIKENPQWKSYMVDVKYPQWKTFVFSQTDAYLTLGVHGFFLDTVDTVDVYSDSQWDTTHKKESIQAMIDLIRAFKEQYPTSYVVMNRGLNIIGRTLELSSGEKKMKIPGLFLASAIHKNNPNGIVWEDAYGSDDDWTRAKTAQFATIKKLNPKCTIFTLGYGDQKVSSKLFKEKSKAQGFIPSWANSRALDTPTE